MCSELEDVRLKEPVSYRILKELIDFAIRVENGAEGIAELISNPPKLHVTEADVKYMIKNKGRIFNERSDDDVDYSRCRLPNARERDQIGHKAAVEIKEV